MDVNATIEIAGPALAAGLMVAFVHAPLGLEVLRRGIVFIDLAVAQIAGLGMTATTLYWPDAPRIAVQAATLLAALLAASAFRLIERVLPERLEALIGCSFVLAASLALLLLDGHPQGGEEMRHLLGGQILFVTWKDAALHAPVYAFVLSAWLLCPKMRAGAGFYALFALAVTSSVQLVGVYATFAGLILPALAAVPARVPLAAAWGCGIVSVAAGIAWSVLADAPAGPAIVCAYAVAAGGISAVLYARKRRRVSAG